MTKVYQLHDFINIKNNYNISLHPDILNSVNNLVKLIEGLKENKNSEQNYEKSKRKKRVDNTLYPPIPKTIINKKFGIDKEIDIIRILLNKLTSTSYNNISQEIISKLNNFQNSFSDQDLIKLANNIFNILSNNSLFSNLSANLLKDLSNYSFIINTIHDKINDFSKIFDDLEIIDFESLSFDEISKYNKKQDEYKSTSKLICNLVKNNTINVEILSGIINKFFDLFLNLVNGQNNLHNVEKISDILFILILESYIYLKNLDCWQKINNNINFICNLKISNNLSVSSRVIFKFMDINDTFKTTN